jgi:hypothetical protein
VKFPAPRAPRARRYAAPLCLLLGAMIPLLQAGCSSVASSICQDSCDCQGCSTTALQTCEQTADDNVKVASDVGCGSEVSTYLSCFSSRAQCIGATYSSGGCDVEFKKVANCLISAKCTIDSSFTIHC